MCKKKIVEKCARKKNCREMSKKKKL